MPRPAISISAILLAILAGAAPGSAAPLPATTPGVADRASSPSASPVQADVPRLYDDTVVRNVSITVAASDWLTALGCPTRGTRPGSTSRTDVPAALEVDGTRLADVGVRCKGNSSLNISGTKKPINVTTDAFVDGQDLWGFDVINLNNGWSDPSLLREALSLRLMAEYLPVSRFSFARVTINGQYLGLYTMVEQVNGEWADHWYPEDGGIIIKGDSPTRIAFNSSTLNWQGESLSPYKQDYEAKGAAAGSDAAYERLREFIRALDAPVSSGGLSDAAFPAGIRQVLDVETALWYLATSNITANFDSYYVGKNYYMYIGKRDPRFHIVPWDMSLAFGVFGLQDGGRPSGRGTSAAQVDPFAQLTNQNRPLIRRLLAVPAYRADYLAHYRALLDETFTPSWIETIGTRYQDLIRAAAREEATTQGRIAGSFTFEQFEANLREAVGASSWPGVPGGPGGGGAPGILALVNDRRAYLATQTALAAPDVRLVEQGHLPVEVTVSDAVVVHAAFAGAAPIADVEVRYRLDGGFEHIRPATRDESGVWSATIPAARQGVTVGYVFRVGLADGSAAFFPPATLTRPYTYHVAGISLPRGETGDLVINELMADNETTLADEAGEYDDWLELYNRGADPIELDGYYLSDHAEDPFAYALPDTRLEPGAHLLIWCDNDPEQGDRHAPFRLGADGETVSLTLGSEIVDAVTFPPLPADAAYLRLPDGTDTWIACDAATPNQANACPAPGAPTPGTPTQPPPTPRQPSPTPSEATPTTPPATTPPPSPTAPALPSRWTAWLPWAKA